MHEKFIWRPFFLEIAWKHFLKNFFFSWRALALVFLVLGLGLEHSCPWPREGLSLEGLSLALASNLLSSTPPLLRSFLLGWLYKEAWCRLCAWPARYLVMRCDLSWLKSKFKLVFEGRGQMLCFAASFFTKIHHLSTRLDRKINLPNLNCWSSCDQQRQTTVACCLDENWIASFHILSIPFLT